MEQKIVPEPDHDVIFYGSDDATLTRKVVTFLGEGLQEGGAAILVAVDHHLRAMRSGLAALGIDAEFGRYKGRLICLDANQILAQLFVDGRIAPVPFSRIIGELVRALAGRHALRVYGEVVGVLRTNSYFEGALQLEYLWMALMREVPFHLLCGYPIDVLSEEFDTAGLDAITSTHSRLYTTLSGLSEAVQRGVDTLSETRHQSIWGMIDPASRPKWASMSEPEATIRWLRENLPHHAEELVDYAREHFAAPQLND